MLLGLTILQIFGVLLTVIAALFISRMLTRPATQG